MKTLIFTLEKAKPTGYPLRLELLPSEDQPRQVLAQAELPLDLVVPDVPDLGITGSMADGLRQIVLKAQEYEPKLEAVGQYLFKLLSIEPVGSVWEEQVDSYGGAEVRCVLDIRAEELKLLPWELMVNGLRRLFAQVQYPFVRGTINWTKQITPEVWPLRVLIVVGCDDETSGNEPDIQARQEVEAIEDVFRGLGKTVYWQVMWRPTQEVLGKAFEVYKPHVFHFIGHGRGAAAGTNAILEFRSEPPWGCSAADMLGLFDAAKWKPRLAVLNACHSADLARQTGTWNLVDGLQQAGVVAILGMQAEVRDDAAASFGQALYRALSEGAPLDTALAKARNTVKQRAGNEGWLQRDWALPSLTLSVPPTQVLTVELDEKKKFLRQQIESVEMFAQLQNFVAREEERWRLWCALNPAVGDSVPFLAVRGPKAAGKTALAKWCLEGCLLQGRAAKYVDLNSGKNNDFLDVLRAIRDETRPTALFTGDALQPEVFAAFNRALNSYQSGGAFLSGSNDSTISSVDEGKPLREGSAGDKELIVQTFCRALQAAVANAPLILVLDHVRVNAADWHSYLYPHLIRNIIERTVPNLSVIMVLTEDQFLNEFKLAGRESIEVSLFEAARYEPLAWDFCRFYKTVKLHPKFAQPGYEDGVRQIIRYLRLTNINGPWSPEELIALRQTLKLV